MCIRHLRARVAAGLLVGAFLSTSSFAQSTPAPSLAPPPLVPMTGTVLELSGEPRTGQTVLTFSVYADQTGGTALWQEVQIVALDARGRYSVLLGSSTDGGMPVALFSPSETRWLGVQAEGQEEQPRILVTSVPYALKAADANTLGGLPASAFQLSSTADIRHADAIQMSAADAGASAAARQDAVPGVVPYDVVTADDAVVQGSLCVGLDCVNGESFDFDTIRMKENNLRIKFDDTSTAAGFPANDWQLTANDSVPGGASYFAIEDITGVKVPFKVMAGAPSNSLYVSSAGIGLGTNAPVLDIHVDTSDTPALRFEQNASGGFTAQTWDVAGNEANFFVRDVTNGSKLPFRIRPGAPTSSIDIAASGNVGIGTTSPSQKLYVEGSTVVEGTLFLGDGSVGDIRKYGAAQPLQFRSASGTVEAILDGSGNLGVGTTSPSQKLYVEGNTVVSGTLFLGDGSVSDIRKLGASQPLQFRSASGTVEAILDGNGNFGIGTASPANPLEMGSGAYVSAGGVWTNASSRELKDKITDLSASDAWLAFEHLKPVTFVYKVNPTEAHTGFIAEDVPDLVATADRKSLAAMDIVAVLTKVMQEQQATIADLQARLAQVQSLLTDAADPVDGFTGGHTRKSQLTLGQ